MSLADDIKKVQTPPMLTDEQIKDSFEKLRNDRLTVLANTAYEAIKSEIIRHTKNGEKQIDDYVQSDKAAPYPSHNKTFNKLFYLPYGHCIYVKKVNEETTIFCYGEDKSKYKEPPFPLLPNPIILPAIDLFVQKKHKEYRSEKTGFLGLKKKEWFVWVDEKPEPLDFTIFLSILKKEAEKDNVLIKNWEFIPTDDFDHGWQFQLRIFYSYKVQD